MSPTHKIFLAVCIISSIVLPCISQQAFTITSDKQFFGIDTAISLFEGNVKVSYNGLSIKSPKASLHTDKNFNPQNAIFEQGVNIALADKEVTNTLSSENVTVEIGSNTLVAQGNTNSLYKKAGNPVVTLRADRQVIDVTGKTIMASGNVIIETNNTRITGQSAKLLNSFKGEVDTLSVSGDARISQGDQNIKAGSLQISLKNNNFSAHHSVLSTFSFQGKNASIRSDYQQFDKSKDLLIASGHVVIHYDAYTASGPKATIFFKENRPDRIVFLGRSSIKESMREVSADRIELTLSPRNFQARGNVKTTFTKTSTVPKKVISPSDNTVNSSLSGNKP